MLNPLSRTPFLSLLIPLLIGIIVQYYLQIPIWSIAFFAFGAITMLLSYFIPLAQQYNLRWLFGAGLSLFVVGVGIFTTSFSQQQTSFVFGEAKQTYRAEIIDVPQEKNKTTAYKVRLLDYDRKIICYLQRDSLANKRLTPGDILTIDGRVQPFKNFADTISFDYVSYMHNKGFSGSAYVGQGDWHPSCESTFSFTSLALQSRQRILKFYKSLGFDQTQYSILSALTVGYQDDLTADVKQSFRTTGTVHVLSVSGLHVGIIYMMISFLLAFIKPRSTYYWSKPLLIMLLLWIYAFVSGLNPPIIRASIMLSVLCTSQLVGRKNYPIHSLYIAAFFMLLVSPLSFFDIGFQLSFSSTFFILWLHPYASKAIKTKNKYVRKLWQLFTLSLVAQLGTFPLCLYYFGTFPTYFFVTNMLIVPLVTLITYAMAGVALAKVLSMALPQLSAYFFYLPVTIVQLLVQLMTSLISFFEKLPSALIDNFKISFLDLLFLMAIIASICVFFIYKKPKSLIVGLGCTLLLICIHLYENLNYSLI